ncbi:MAG: ABC transporter permease [Bacteroidota bacterium]
MLRNYLLITWRNLKRNPMYMGLNILGLSIGIAASLLIWQYVIYEKSYDTFFEDRENLYRVRLDRYNNEELNSEWAAGCSPVGKALADNFPEVLNYTKMHSREAVFTLEDRSFREVNAYTSTASIFDMFSLEIVSGDPQKGLENPNTLVLSESIAKKYFGEEDPLGKTLEVSNTGNLEVVGVFADLPPNSHFNFEILISHPTIVNIFDEEMETAWQWDGFYNYVQLRPQTDTELLAEKLNAYVVKADSAYLVSANHRMDFSFQPLTSIHLTSQLLFEFKPNGDAKTVTFMTLVGILILLIAWINYINLSTARAIDRGKEVGVRKTNGASRKELIVQFLFEALILNLISAIIGLSLYQLTSSLINQLTEIPLSFSLWSIPWFFPIFFFIIVIGAILTGLYPAFIMSAFRPIDALKGHFRSSLGRSKFSLTQTQLRKGLVVLQFSSSILLIAATFTVFRQMRFMEKQEAGMSLEQTLVVRGPVQVDSTYNQKMASFLQNVEKIPGVIQTATSSTIPGVIEKRNAGGVRLWGADPSEGKQYDRQFMNPQYLDLYEVELIAGENFSQTPFQDTSVVILNEAAVAHMGIASPEEAVGKQIFVWGDRLTIKGVIKDYFHRSMKQHPLPTLFIYYPYCIAYQSIKMESASIANAIPDIQNEFENFFPGNPYAYFFADENYSQLYNTEKTSGRIFSLFSILAVGIACLGLFGLVSFALGRRTKEIGIRKVLGASHSHIFNLLLKDFTSLVIVAGFIAVPLSFWAIQSWLKDYPYRISIQPDLFIFPIVMVMGLAFLTILRTTLLSAQAKPVDAIRSE